MSEHAGCITRGTWHRVAPVLLWALSMLTGCTAERDSTTDTGFSVASALGAANSEGFARADRPRAFRFPHDHGPHPRFRNEWWYLTGNLQAGGRRFGYQLTLFRIALAPARPPSRSAWATHTVWLAHAAVTDISAGRHMAAEQLVRESLGLAGARRQPLKVWVGNWMIEAEDSQHFPGRIEIDTQRFSLDLGMVPHKPIVLQGDDGLSQKGPAAGNASYYYSITRLRTQGSLGIDGNRYQVSGWSWLDREWSTRALARDQVGWDWFSLQLHSGADLMYYRLRRRDGTAHPLSAGTWVDKAGAATSIDPTQIQLTPTRYWTGPTGTRYPVEWQLTYRGQRWRIEAAVDDQLMELSVRYWEGAVNVYRDGALTGRGYLEMTGY